MVWASANSALLNERDSRECGSAHHKDRNGAHFHRISKFVTICFRVKSMSVLVINGDPACVSQFLVREACQFN